MNLKSGKQYRFRTACAYRAITVERRLWRGDCCEAEVKVSDRGSFVLGGAIGVGLDGGEHRCWTDVRGCDRGWAGYR